MPLDPEPIRVDARPLSPGEESALRAGPVRTVRVREPRVPATPEAVARARMRGMILGATMTAAAAVGAAITWWGYRRWRG